MKKCKVGVLGVGRGSMLWMYCKNAGNAEIVAVCDKWEEGLNNARRQIDSDTVTYYTDYDEFLKHDMDVVFLANYATQHAPFAIKAMKAGKDVASEVLPAQTLAQAVELIDCIESTGRKYCYAENYCFMGGPREMRKKYREGLIGEFEYGEGEYLHNCESIWADITQGNPEHWRNNMSAFYYCTHSIGPLIHITGLKPVKVSGFEMPFNKRMARMGAKAGHSAVEMITLENGGVIKSVHGVGCSKNSIWYTVYTEQGRMETAREDAEADNVSRIYVNMDPAGGPSDNDPVTYLPEDEQSRKAAASGHGGSDYICLGNIFDYMNGEDTEVIDVYEAMDMWLPGVFGYFSVLEGGVSKEIPDFRDPKVRETYRNDHRCTDPAVAGDQLIPSYSKGNPEIPAKIYEGWKQKWEASLAPAGKAPQLVMYWKNDGKPCEPLNLPEGVTVETFNTRPTALEDWLNIVFHGLTDKIMDADFYKSCMTDRPWYDDSKCFFLIKDNRAAATVTVICDPETKEGYIHMVACRESFRGQGLGSVLNRIAVRTLKEEGMETASLTTDDFRIPAICGYLTAGFRPDLSTQDYRDRWEDIRKIINKPIE